MTEQWPAQTSREVMSFARRCPTASGFGINMRNNTPAHTRRSGDRPTRRGVVGSYATIGHRREKSAGGFAHRSGEGATSSAMVFPSARGGNSRGPKMTAVVGPPLRGGRKRVARSSGPGRLSCCRGRLAADIGRAVISPRARPEANAVGELSRSIRRMYEYAWKAAAFE
jgi:hypothetical protein